ncbi:GM13102 [Drosophila sechellia]|uniref:GM13102 n=1 Tax=Drosophila sechellia TaxID=7238 RepID=B4IK48_DROSE|nr:GM13102 [Drosophila sechellia]
MKDYAGSTALGFYTPMKGTAMDNLFQLGVTRYALPESSSSGSSNGSHSPGSNGSSPAGAAGSRLMFNGNGSIMGIGEGLIKEGDLAAAEAGPGAADGVGASKKGSVVDEDDYHLTATPGAEVVYSEGTQKTDLLY